MIERRGRDGLVRNCQTKAKNMKTVPVPARVIKELEKIEAVWVAHDDFAVGPEVTLKKIKDTRGQLEECTAKLVDLKRQITEQTNLRDDCARIGNDLVVRARKGIVGFFGPDSTQYAQAGGTRASERKAPTRGADKTVPLMNKAA